MDFKTKRIGEVMMISDVEISRVTGIHPVTVLNALSDFGKQDGQSDTIYKCVDESLIYADRTAFYELSVEFDIDEGIQQAVLKSLGEFDIKNNEWAA